MREFLERILPASGYKILDFPKQGSQGSYFKHNFFTSLDDFCARAAQLSAEGFDVYHACSSFVEPKSRKSVNVQAVKAFWVDLDVGDEPTKYQSQLEAVEAIIAFSQSSGLITPTLVSSGYGVHAYWPLVQEIEPARWRARAEAFKAMLSASNIRQDTSRTADMASVLRTPGTFNYKRGDRRPVELLVMGDTMTIEAFESVVTPFAPNPTAALAAPPAYALNAPQATAPSSNAAFGNIYSNIPTDANLVADSCAQIRRMRDTRGNISEPEWYACIGVLRFCENGRNAIQEWSSGHPTYSEEATDAKIAHAEQGTPKPITCEKFAGINATGCLGCPNRGKVTTPLQLGRKAVESKDVSFAEEQIISPPHPFFIDDAGRVGLNIDGKAEYISPYPFYFKSRFWSLAEKEFCYLLRYWYPQDGWQEAVVTSVQLGVFNDFVKAVSRIDLRLENMNMAFKFLNAYADQLKALVATQKMVHRQGWHEASFVLGETSYHQDGTTTPVTLAPTVGDYREAFVGRGSAELWKAAVAPFGKSMPHAFGILTGFASPLMRFTSYDGAVVNLLGETGCGKSTVQQIVASIYGEYRLLDMKHADTAMSKFRRLGIYSSLPATIDEITNVHPEELSSFIYQVSQGRERNRLRNDGTERTNPHTWQTIVLSSSNRSIYEALSAYRADTQAESIRALEIQTIRTPTLTRELVDNARLITRDNFGMVGIQWIRHVSMNQDRLSAEVRAMQEAVFKLLNAKTHHRYWVAVIACAIVSADELRKLGIFNVSIEDMTSWLGSLFVHMENNVNQFHTDSLDMFSAWEMRNLDKRIIFDGNADKRSKMFKPPIEVPRGGELVIRIEQSTRRMFVAKKSFVDWLTSQNASPVSVIKDLRDAGLILGEERVSLGAGWNAAMPTTRAFVIDLNHMLFKESPQLVAVEQNVQTPAAANM